MDVIDLRQHQLWIAETESKSERALVIADSQWQLVLISLTNAKRAQKVLADFRQQGFVARSKTMVRQGPTLHRLLLPGFESIVLPGMLYPGLSKPRVLAMPGYGSSRIPRAT